MILNIAKYPVNLMSGKGHAGRILFLTYHRVLKECHWFLKLEPHATVFEKQMRFIKSYFNPLRLTDALNLLDAGGLPPRAVCITFDDGYANNHDIALPILKKLDVPATFFVATGYLSGGAMWNDQALASIRVLPNGRHYFDWLGSFDLASEHDRIVMTRAALGALKHSAPDTRKRCIEDLMLRAGISVEDLSGMMMSGEMVKSLSDAGMEIGAHTVNHPILSTLSAHQAHEEIVASKQHLETLIGRPVMSFAYPNGRYESDFTSRDVSIVKAAGFRSAVTTEWGAATSKSNRHLLPRIGLRGTEPFKLMLQLARAYGARDRLGETDIQAAAD